MRSVLQKIGQIWYTLLLVTKYTEGGILSRCNLKTALQIISTNIAIRNFLLWQELFAWPDSIPKINMQLIGVAYFMVVSL
jgi:hypothetical protein